MREVIKRNKFIFFLIIILGISAVFLFNGFKSEIEATKVIRRYDAISFPQYITHTTNKGLIKYRGDLKLNSDSVTKDKNIYYAEYFGVMESRGINFLK